jgi:hypothetical protein
MLTPVRMVHRDIDPSCLDLIWASANAGMMVPLSMDAYGSSPWAESPRVNPGHDELNLSAEFES